MNNKPLVLILCTGNSCRSQMAEGFLRHYQDDAYQVGSAGTEPKDEVHSFAVRAMIEIGIDISDQRPKPLERYLGVAPVRHLLIVCDKAQGTCPRIWPGAFTRDYLPFEDPANARGTDDEVMEVFRRVRDEIGQSMRTWSPAIEKAGHR